MEKLRARIAKESAQLRGEADRQPIIFGQEKKTETGTNYELIVFVVMIFIASVIFFLE